MICDFTDLLLTIAALVFSALLNASVMLFTVDLTNLLLSSLCGLRQM